MSPGKLNIKSSSRLLRFEKVISTLIKYGFEDLLAKPPFNKLVPQSNILVPQRDGKKVSKFTTHERVRMVCEELGTTFIKFAQIASNRPDLLPDDLISELEKLQDQAPVVSLTDIYSILEKELPRTLGQMVSSFNKVPIACASMAQVHRATLKGGKEVVLKIQRPKLREVIAADLAILKNLVSIIENYFPKYKIYQPKELVRMFEQSISEELSFKVEAKNLVQFQKMFAKNPNVYIPDIYQELSTDKVICMEYIDGYKITDLENLKAFKITGKELALKGIGLYFEQVFEHGFFHADPHPGNIFVLENSKIAFIDYGMVGIIIESDKILFAKILLAIYDKDVQGLKKAIMSFSTGLDKDQQRNLEYDINYFLRHYSTVSIEDIDGNEVMKGLNALFFDYKIKIPSNLLLLLKALIIIEGVGLKLDPQYDIIQNIGPYVKKLLEKKYNPQRLSQEVLRSAENSIELLKELPEDIREIIHKIKEGKLHIEFEHIGLETVSNDFSSSINRLSFTLIVVAIIIGSSLLVVAKTPPLYKNLPIIGIIGYVIAALMMLRAFYAFKKHGNL